VGAGYLKGEGKKGQTCPHLQAAREQAGEMHGKMRGMVGSARREKKCPSNPRESVAAGSRRTAVSWKKGKGNESFIKKKKYLGGD